MRHLENVNWNECDGVNGTRKKVLFQYQNCGYCPQSGRNQLDLIADMLRFTLRRIWELQLCGSLNGNGLHIHDLSHLTRHLKNQLSAALLNVSLDGDLNR